MKLLLNDEAISHGHVHWELQQGKILPKHPSLRKGVFLKLYPTVELFYILACTSEHYRIKNIIECNDLPVINSTKVEDISRFDVVLN